MGGGVFVVSLLPPPWQRFRHAMVAHVGFGQKMKPLGTPYAAAVVTDSVAFPLPQSLKVVSYSQPFIGRYWQGWPVATVYLVCVPYFS